MKPRTARIRYSERDDQLILENYWKPEAERTEILKQLDVKRSDHAVFQRFCTLVNQQMGMKVPDYKQMMREKAGGQAPAQPESPSVESEIVFKPEKEFYAEIETPPVIQPEPEPEPEEPLRLPVGSLPASKYELMKLYGRIDALEAQVKQEQERFSNWMDSAFYMYRSGLEYKDLLKIMHENVLLKDEILCLKERTENAMARASRAKDETLRLQNEYQSIYKELDHWLGQFLRMGAIDKVSTLEDFIPRMKAVVDKFGTVVRLNPEPSSLSLFDPQ